MRPIGRRTAPRLARLSERLAHIADTCGKWGSLFLIPLILVTIWDVTCRKLVWIQIWLVEHFGRVFESTVLQELEWHFHTALFALVLGYGYVHNSHVRVDLVREKLSFRKQAWIEFLGGTFFMLPYCGLIIYFAAIFAYDSFMINEISASQVGLGKRWIIKSVFVVGMLFALIAGFAVWLQSLLMLFGPPDLRFRAMAVEWPEDRRAREAKRAS